MSGSVSSDTAGWRSLAGAPLLAGLLHERLRALGEGSWPYEHPAGQVMHRAGDPATHLVVLLRGRVSADAWGGSSVTACGTARARWTRWL
ncbi:hypothetical protein ABZ897_12675 [Nonomuraea sp. NPDC046802]|uniref:hypothetical protein n=1 Tax=Nonomuraea sp. NPDC046802 TaxID=3154919 RepID=UPI0033E13F85